MKKTNVLLCVLNWGTGGGNGHIKQALVYTVNNSHMKSKE